MTVLIYLIQVEEKLIEMKNFMGSARDIDEKEFYSIIEKHYYGFISVDDLKEYTNVIIVANKFFLAPSHE